MSDKNNEQHAIAQATERQRMTVERKNEASRWRFVVDFIETVFIKTAGASNSLTVSRDILGGWASFIQQGIHSEENKLAFSDRILLFTELIALTDCLIDWHFFVLKPRPFAFIIPPIIISSQN